MYNQIITYESLEYEKRLILCGSSEFVVKVGVLVETGQKVVLVSNGVDLDHCQGGQYVQHLLTVLFTNYSNLPINALQIVKAR